jgi:hypothetical protein
MRHKQDCFYCCCCLSLLFLLLIDVISLVNCAWMGRTELVGSGEWASDGKQAGRQVLLLGGVGFSVQFT